MILEGTIDSRVKKFVVVRPTLIYATETGPDTVTIKQILETIETQTFRKILRVNRKAHIHTQRIRSVH